MESSFTNSPYFKPGIYFWHVKSTQKGTDRLCRVDTVTTVKVFYTMYYKNGSKIKTSIPRAKIHEIMGKVLYNSQVKDLGLPVS